MNSLSIVVFGLSITSSWGNGHAVTYRGLIRELQRRGHNVIFFEKDVPWYSANRDLPNPDYCKTVLYSDFLQVKKAAGRLVRNADLVIMGSYVPDGVEVGRWLLDTALNNTAFYDIDTPVTISKISRGDYEYISPELIPEFDLYLSFTGGRMLRRLETEFGAAMARPLYCSVDPSIYYPEPTNCMWDLGYLGTYSEDRQPSLKKLLLEPARSWQNGKFIVAGSLYPDSVVWAPNVMRMGHVPPSRHRAFYTSQKFTLNITRADMIRSGWSPSIRLFEAAACGTPIVSDWWKGLDDIFKPGEEILVADSTEEVLYYLLEMPDETRMAVARAARKRALQKHTAKHRVLELEHYLTELTRKSPECGEKEAVG